MEKKLTINDIAKLAGVAKSTVSRYLNEGSVKKETAEKIKKIIEENGYEPNVFARLSAKSSKIIGLVVPGFNSITTPRVVEVIVSKLKEEGYTPLILHTNNSMQEEKNSIFRLHNMKVDGIIVISIGITEEDQKEVKLVETPVLYVGQNSKVLNSIVNDDYNAGYAVGEHIGKSGAKKIIGLWVDEQDIAVGKNRKKGVEDGLAKYSDIPIEFHYTSYNYNDAVNLSEKILLENDYPEAIICATDRIAQGVYKTMSSRNIKIGENISVIGFGDYETDELLMPPLTSVKFDWNQTGEISVDTILKMIKGEDVPRVQFIEFELKSRKSVVIKHT